MQFSDLVSTTRAKNSSNIIRVVDICQRRKKFRLLHRALRRSVVKMCGRFLDRTIHAQANPLSIEILLKQMKLISVCRHLDDPIRLPVSFSIRINLKVKCNRFLLTMSEMQNTFFITSDQIRSRILSGRDRILHPWTAPADRLSKLMNPFPARKPEVRLRMIDARIFKSRNIICRENKTASLPVFDIADDFQITADRTKFAGILNRQIRWKIEKTAMMAHQKPSRLSILFRNCLSNPQPFRMPAMRAFVGEISLRKSKLMPLSLLHHHQEKRTFIPAGCPDRRFFIG